MSNLLMVTLLSLVFLFQGTSDLYASSMPEMMKFFMTNQAGIQLTIILFLIAYGLGQFIWVYLSNMYSRKNIIIFNIVLFIVSSIVAMCASSLEVLYLARILQGFAISGLNLNVKAIPMEICNPKEAKIFYTYFALVWGAGGTIAPWIGSNIQHFFNWKYNFAALAIYAFIILFLAKLFIPNIKNSRKSSIYFSDYIEVISNKGFLSGVIAQSCTLAMFLAFNYYMSFYVQNVLHYSELTFGYISFIAGLCFVLGCLLFRLAIARLVPNKLSIGCSIASFLLATIIVIVNIKANNMILTVIITWAIIFCSGVMASENIGITMMFFPDKASVASCLHTAIHFMVTSGLMYILSLFSYASLAIISGFYLLLIFIFFITNQYCFSKLPTQKIR